MIFLAVQISDFSIRFPCCSINSGKSLETFKIQLLILFRDLQNENSRSCDSVLAKQTLRNHLRLSSHHQRIKIFITKQIACSSSRRCSTPSISTIIKMVTDIYILISFLVPQVLLFSKN